MKAMETSRRSFLITTSTMGCAAFCSVIAMNFAAGCDTVEQGDAVIDLDQEHDLQTVGGAVKKRYAKINDTNPILIIHESENHFVAYSALCTHKGVEVRLPKNGIIVCPNHGSQFSSADGTVLDGLAIQPLKKIPLHFDEQRRLITLG